MVPLVASRPGSASSSAIGTATPRTSAPTRPAKPCSSANAGRRPRTSTKDWVAARAAEGCGPIEVSVHDAMVRATSSTAGMPASRLGQPSESTVAT